jgi:hypothetical protein
MKAAMDCCMQLHQWDQALQLAQQCNFTEAEGLLQQYAQHLLEKRKYLEALELYRKASARDKFFGGILGRAERCTGPCALPAQQCNNNSGCALRD